MRKVNKLNSYPLIHVLKKLRTLLICTENKVHTLHPLTAKRGKKSDLQIFCEPVASVTVADDIETTETGSNVFIELAEKKMMENQMSAVRTFFENSMRASMEDLKSLMGLSMSTENLQYLSIHEHFSSRRGLWQRIITFFRKLFSCAKIG